MEYASQFQTSRLLDWCSFVGSIGDIGNVSSETQAEFQALTGLVRGPFSY